MIYEMTISIKKKMELKFDVYKFFFSIIRIFYKTITKFIDQR